MTDTRGNTYQLAATVSQTSDGHQIWPYYAENFAGGANTVTASVSGSPSGYVGFVIAEYSGIVTSGALDKTKTAIGSGTFLSTGSTATTSFSDELLVGYFGMSEGGSGFSPTSGFELKGYLQHSQGGRNQSAFLDRLVNSTGAYALTATTGSTEVYSGILATFKRAPYPMIRHRVNNY